MAVAGGGLLLGACGRDRVRAEGSPGPSVTPGIDPSALAPASRPSLRLGGGALGFPSPFGYIAVPGYRQMSLIYDTLLWKDGSGRLLPWLASSYEPSENGLVHTFELRDVRWHDGQPLTADDVVFTFDYYRKNTLGPLVVFQPYGVDKVVAVGPGTVRVHLNRPDATFAEALAGTLPIAPRHVWEKVGDPAGVQDPSVLVGSGPYRLAQYNGDGGALLYTANDSYFLGRPFVQRIAMIPVADELTAVLTGQTDAGEAQAAGARPDVLAPFRSDPFGVVDAQGGFTFPLYWNLGKGGPLADVRFRRACALAIDRADVVQRLTGGNGLPGNPGFLAPTNPFHVDVEQYALDRRAANQLLDDAGYARAGDGVRRTLDGRELRFELLYPSMLAPLAEVVHANLKEVGIGLTLQGVELGPALYAKKLAGDYAMALTLYPGPSGAGPNADPDQLRTIFSSRVAKGLGSANGYADRELDQLAERQLAAFNADDRRKMVARMQEIVARDVPVLPLYYSTLFTVFRQDVFDQWYITPGQFPVGGYNRQLFVTGVPSGSTIRPEKS